MNDGGPAFPFDCTAPGNTMRTVHTGMTLRDWFAGQTLPCILKAYVIRDDAEGHENAARMAYEFSDAMLAERQKGTS